MARRNISIHAVLLASSMIAWPAMAADVTPDRLLNPDKEPGNWLMNHRTYDAQRYSPLDIINKTNVKSLKLAYAVAIGGTSVNENLQATPLAEDGFLYIVDLWAVVYKIDGRSGDVAGSSGAWIRARRKCPMRTEASHCGAISSFQSPTTPRA
jgi:alcohol dehydrogenase (cytochrome c)